MDAHEALLQAAELLRERAPVEASDARFLAMEAAWAGGDVEACLAALDGGAEVRGLERDFADGLSAALTVRLDDARTALARVVAGEGGADDPRLLLRAGAAALVLGDTAVAARIHARALVRARAEHRTALLPHALEQLAYAELRAGRYGRAALAAREGLRTAEATGQHNVAAHQHAVLALVASVKGDGSAVAEHAGRALETAGPHGLVQAATLAEWALARAERGRGLAAQAAARLVPLVRPGPRRSFRAAHAGGPLLRGDGGRGRPERGGPGRGRGVRGLGRAGRRRSRAGAVGTLPCPARGGRGVRVLVP